MSEQRLRELLRTTAEPIGPPYLVETAWAGARERQRRHRRIGLVATAAVATAVVLLGVVRSIGGPGPTDHRASDGTTSTAQSVRTAGIPTTVAPLPGSESALPSLATDIPSTVDTDPADAPALSTHPLRRALALFAPYPTDWPQSTTDHPTVLVLGDDGQLRRIDTAQIRGTKDGFAPAPVTGGSLSPDGIQAAFPEYGNTVLVVNLRTGQSHRFPFAGPVRSVTWLPFGPGALRRGRLIVDQGDGSRLLDLASGQSTPMPYREVAQGTLSGAADRVVSLPSTEDDPPALATYTVDGNGRQRTSLDLPAGLGDWDGAAFAAGSTVVRTSGAFNLKLPASVGDQRSAYAVVVLRPGQAKPVRILALTTSGDDGTFDERDKSCCSVLARPGNGDTVLLDSRGREHRILAWNTRTGKLWQVARLTEDAQVALNDMIVLAPNR